MKANFIPLYFKGVIDASYKFIFIGVGGFGEQNDGGTFRGSNLYYFNPNEPPSHGVTVHMNCSNIRRNLDANKVYFNMWHSCAKWIVQSAFGIRNATFRILWKPIETYPNFTDKILKYICRLHNIIIYKV